MGHRTSITRGGVAAESASLEEAIKSIVDPVVVMRRVVDEARALIPAADGAVVELAHDETLTYVCAAGSLSDHVGLRLGIHGSFSGLSIESGETLICRDSRADERVDAEACRRVGAVSMVCVPLRRGAERVGVLKVSATRPEAFDTRDVATLAKLAEFITWAITSASDFVQLTASWQQFIPATPTERQPTDFTRERGALAAFVGNVMMPGLVASVETSDRVASVIATGSMRTACQPIVAFDSGRVVGVEALARFPSPPEQPPDRWFAEAHAAGIGVDLEIDAVRSALKLLDHLPEDMYLAINAGPDAVRRIDDLGLLNGVGQRLVVELTEHIEVDDYDALCSSIDRLREIGARIAIDDTGSGISTFAHILRLAPDVIKLDRVLTMGIDTDPVRRALAGALMTFAAETGATVIAEGIETAAELDTVQRLDIRYGQGFYLGRPGSIETLRARCSRVPRPGSAMRA